MHAARRNIYQPEFRVTKQVSTSALMIVCQTANCCRDTHYLEPIFAASVLQLEADKNVYNRQTALCIMQAVQAVNLLNGTELAGRKILVREDREASVFILKSSIISLQPDAWILIAKDMEGMLQDFLLLFCGNNLSLGRLRQTLSRIRGALQDRDVKQYNKENGIEEPPRPRRPRRSEGDGTAGNARSGAKQAAVSSGLQVGRTSILLL